MNASGSRRYAEPFAGFGFGVVVVDVVVVVVVVVVVESCWRSNGGPAVGYGHRRRNEQEGGEQRE